jgi:hypothetical protein
VLAIASKKKNKLTGSLAFAKIRTCQPFRQPHGDDADDRRPNVSMSEFSLSQRSQSNQAFQRGQEESAMQLRRRNEEKLCAASVAGASDGSQDPRHGQNAWRLEF